MHKYCAASLKVSYVDGAVLCTGRVAVVFIKGKKKDLMQTEYCSRFTLLRWSPEKHVAVSVVHSFANNFPSVV